MNNKTTEREQRRIQNRDKNIMVCAICGDVCSYGEVCSNGQYACGVEHKEQVETLLKDIQLHRGGSRWK